jgi:hypothetical protein
VCNTLAPAKALEFEKGRTTPDVHMDIFVQTVVKMKWLSFFLPVLFEENLQTAWRSYCLYRHLFQSNAFRNLFP